MLLCKNQKRLKRLEVGPFDGSIKDALQRHPNLIKDLTQLDNLDLYPNDMDCLEACHRILKDTPRLKKLLVDYCYEHARPAPGLSWEDKSNEPGVITSTLFRDKMPFQACTPMTLKVLTLFKANLRWIGQTYMRVIAFPALEELQVRECFGADAIFAEMAKPAKRPTKLKELAFAHVDGQGHQYIQSSLESFLQSIGSIEKLCIILLEGASLPKVEAVCHHAAQLVELTLYSSKTQVYVSESIYAKDDFARICRECTKLQQLAIGCPKTNALGHALAENFVDYLVAPPVAGPVVLLR